MKSSAGWYVAALTLAAIIFIADLLTPLGVGVWFLYVIPLSFTLFGRDEDAPLYGAAAITVLIGATLISDTRSAAVASPAVAQFNRACGIVVTWTLALLIRSLIATRKRVEAERWMRGQQSELLSRLQGDLTLGDIAQRTLDQLAEAIRAPVAALYVPTGGLLTLTATRGLHAGSDVPETVAFGEGLVGAAARSRQTATIAPVGPELLPVRSSLIHGPASAVTLWPIIADGALQAVAEFGTLREPPAPAIELLGTVQTDVGVALRAAQYRDQLRDLLEETQRQAEELQTQQEELRVANEELEEHGRALQASQTRLETQQAELEATNAQLGQQAAELEQQTVALGAATREAEEASRYKSEFLANMSHELRTPLNSALILARLLAENREGRLSPDQVRYAETIYASGNNLLTLINDILDLSKIEAGAVDLQYESVATGDLVARLQQMFQPMADQKQLSLAVEIDPAAPVRFETDVQRLQQILTNLLSNAFKFTEKGGVAVRVASAGANQLQIDVRDSGVGIPRDKFDVIFQAFRQADGSTHRKYGGTGLGLSISLELAHLLGGDLRVASEPGVGSTFTLRVPTRRTADQTARTSGARRPAPSRARTPQLSSARPTDQDLAPGLVDDDRLRLRHPGRLILVVEDDAAFARILYEMAQELQFDCVIATTNDEGLMLARRLMPSGILLDIALPDGSGLTLLDRLKRSPDTRHIPVHIVSATDQARAALELGAVGFALKPVTRDAIAQAIERLARELQQRMRRVLIVEDDPELRESTKALLRLDDVAIDAVGTAAEALSRLASESYDCIVLDLKLPDGTGYDVLEQMAAHEQYSFPPVIVYTGWDLSREDEERLHRYSRSVVLKGARSPERLLDEVTLFLHQVEAKLPDGSQRLLRAARDRDELFDGRTILIVEDDVRNVYALTSVFEPRGATVRVARNGREALEQVRTNRPDLVLMDIMMPEMDGLTAIRRLRESPEYKDLPIIALTAKAMRNDYEECLSAGASDYMAKPLDVDKLVSLSRVWIAR